MKKTVILFSEIIFVMLILPLIAVKFVPADAGMAVCFILFFAVNPLFSVFVGIASGKNKNMWYMPIVSAVIFVISCWILFDMGETAFVRYAIYYAVIGLLSMSITKYICKRKEENK